MFFHTKGRPKRSSYICAWRPYLALSGVSAIAMGILAGAGMASMLDFPYTTINGLLPFLCLGIGIDDMFVIVQCYYNNNDENDNLNEAMGKAAMRAGAAISVTPITDIIAFMPGAVTVRKNV